MGVRPTQSREGVKGGFPLAGSRDSVPCGVWGNAPTVSRATNSKEAPNKGAGSEASLPVTSRSRRSAPKLLYPTSMHCRAKWARPDFLTSDHSLSFPQAGVSPLRARQGGNENRRSLRSPPLDPFGFAAVILDFFHNNRFHPLPSSRRYFHVPDPQSAEGIADFA